MKVAQLFILILAFLIIKPADAGLLVEPVVGYSFSKSDMDANTGGVSKDSKGTGASLGGRLGYQNFGFQLGVDYLRSTISNDANQFKSDTTVNEFAGFVGFEFPVLLRVYAGYIFAANGEADYNPGSGEDTLKFQNGTGMKAGIGFTGLPFVDINFEYRKGTFGEYKFGSAMAQEVDTNYSAYMIGISLPFVI